MSDGPRILPFAGVTEFETVEAVRALQQRPPVSNSDTENRGIIRTATEAEGDAGDAASPAMTPALVQRKIDELLERLTVLEGATVIESIQRGTFVRGSSNTLDITITSVDPAKAYLSFNSLTSGNFYYVVSISLTSGTNIRVTGLSADYASDVFSYEVIEFK